MPELKININGKQQSVIFNAGQNLRDILDAANYRVRTGCRGNGACGLCRIRIEKGSVNEPTQNEMLHLSGEQIFSGIRLACQLKATDDMAITIINPAPDSVWQRIPEGAVSRGVNVCDETKKFLPADIKNPYGAAVDIGTTNICISIFELLSGEWLAERKGLNPQMRYGSDVITRLTSASESRENAELIRSITIKAVGNALLDIAKTDGIDIRQVFYLAVTGNTAMISLLSGRNCRLLLQPKNWTKYIDCLPENTGQWINELGIHPAAMVEIIPPLAGFVGSDFLAGITATRLTEGVSPAVFIDFGTNSEIALWDGQTLWVTSAAGGPAFELSGISCGMPAESGAIFRVLHDLSFKVINNCRPLGLCGSGFVDLIACLLHSGKLLKIGKFSSDISSGFFTVAETGQNSISLRETDIDAFQKAKAAIAGGVKVLLKRAGIRFKELKRICIGGEFGKFLDISNCQAVGLLPPLMPDIIEIWGNTSLLGCEDIVLCSAARDRLHDAVSRSKIINLSQEEDFEELFFENLYLEPMRDY
jgi:uncharacterized 2Fe-2S/4Fe-4S cluster protein (DUF4445 family)